jgi:DNA polymerase-3 subunit delta
MSEKNLNLQEVLSSIRQKKYHPVYLLHGDEPYFIDKISDFIEKSVLTEAEKSFNQVILYGRDTEAQTVTDHARRFPMMSLYQVVIIREAQDMRSLTQLQAYVENPSPTTILVICHKHKKLDMRSAFAKALKEKALVFESKSLYDNQVPDWIKDFLKEKKLTATGRCLIFDGRKYG